MTNWCSPASKSPPPPVPEPTPPADADRLVAVLGELAAARRLVAGGGRSLRFVPPDGLAIGYEQRAFDTGEVVTRPGNWHDAFNAQVWIEFPRSKAVLNRAHVQALAGRPASAGRRGSVRDRMTQFDECGVVVAGMPAALWQALVAHRWREVFVDHRATVEATTRFVLFGHASRDRMRAPFVGLCGKALWLDVTPAVRDDDVALDAVLAAELAVIFVNRRSAMTEVSWRWPALPLLGIPGMCEDNRDPRYYDDTRQFRAPRTMSAGSSPGSR